VEEDGDGFPPIFALCLDPRKSCLIPILVTFGKVNVDERMNTRETPLIFASMYANENAVRELLAVGADKTLRDWRGFSALSAVTYAKMNKGNIVNSAACDAVFELLGGKKQCSVCFAPCNAACAQCKIVHYCSQKHQRQHWKDHKWDCKSYAQKIEKAGEND
jgi:hypothetical protein